MAKKQTEITIHDFQKGYLSLPFDEDQFKDFISSLLGQPQTISKNIEGRFEIHLKDLQNFHDLLHQRINQQNNGKLVQLKTQIFFSDQSSVLLSSLAELITYNEVKPIISEQVIMTWTYLIQFSDKNVPEKQEVELKISTFENRKRFHFSKTFLLLPSVVNDSSDNGNFEINVRHTARSWGNDIETLLTNQINSIILKEGKLRTIVNKYRGLLLILFVLGLSYAGIYSLNIRNRLFIENAKKIVSPIIKDGNLNNKVNYLIDFTTSDHTDFLLSNYGFVYFFIVLSSIIIASIILDLVDFNKKSFIVLTREALKNRDEITLKQNKQEIAFIISYVFSILASIIASFIYSNISK